MEIENAYVQEFGSLWATSLNREQHERTCGYWYTVTNGAVAHTAFRTYDEMTQWLAERGLSLAGQLPVDAGEWATVKIDGKYFRSLDRDVDRFNALGPVLVTTVLDNGERTPAKVTEENGVRTVHLVNVNYRERVNA